MLLLVRHGETEINRSGRYLGRADPLMTAHGRAQAARLAELLPRPDVVVTSPLRRAIDTATYLGAPIELDERWIELDYGPYDLRSVGSVPPELAERWHGDPTFAPPGVESVAALSARVRAACAELAARAESSVVVVVSHVGPIKAAIGWALGAELAMSRLFVEDGSVSRIDVACGQPAVRWFNRFGDEAAEGVEESAGGLLPRR
jgi:broad specificity phosphatase PhoE